MISTFYRQVLILFGQEGDLMTVLSAETLKLEASIDALNYEGLEDALKNAIDVRLVLRYQNQCPAILL